MQRCATPPAAQGVGDQVFPAAGFSLTSRTAQPDGSSAGSTANRPANPCVNTLPGQPLLGPVLVRRQVGEVDLLQRRSRGLSTCRAAAPSRGPGRTAAPPTRRASPARGQQPTPTPKPTKAPPKASSGSRWQRRGRVEAHQGSRAEPGRDDRHECRADSEPLGPRRSEGEGKAKARAKARAKACASARPSPSVSESVSPPRPMTATRRRPRRRVVSSPRRSRTAACPSGCRSWCSSGSVVPLVVPSGGVGGPARHDRAAAGEGPAPRSVVALGHGPRRRGDRHHEPVAPAADRRRRRPHRRRCGGRTTPGRGPSGSTSSSDW